MEIGIIEGFFGPEYSMEERKSYASFLSGCGADFYLYAPKRDQKLRKQWREEWKADYQGFLLELKNHFDDQGITFGVGISPMGLAGKFDSLDASDLEKKIRLLQKLGIKLLGVFFDDMPVEPSLALVQIKVVQLIQKNFDGRIIFCPSFYSDDPILEKVFGKMPENYLQDIAAGIPLDIDLAWTGPKVISPEIPRAHLEGVNSLLKRKPFLWENLFANDGPKNCKFLKLKPFMGRSSDIVELISGAGFNMMNQPELSKICFLSSLLVLNEGQKPAEAFENACKELLSPSMAQFIQKENEFFLTQGLDGLSPEKKQELMDRLSEFSDKSAREIEAWLRGEYLVGPECLTD